MDQRICFCVLAQVSTVGGAEQRQSKAESVLPQCCRLKDQQINPDLWKQVNKCLDFLLSPPDASCLCLAESMIIRDSSGRAHEFDFSSLAQTDKELFFYCLLGNGRIFIHFGQPIIFFLLEWLEVPSYPYLSGKWCSCPNTIDHK